MGTPGGHLELGESIEECAKRETSKKQVYLSTRLQVGFTNDVFEKEGKHYVTLFVVASCSSGG